MATKTDLSSGPTTFTTFTAAEKPSLKKDGYSMKRSFRILFGGIAFGWIACMAILITVMLQR